MLNFKLDARCGFVTTSNHKLAFLTKKRVHNFGTQS